MENNGKHKDVILVVDDQPNNLKVISSVLGDSYSLSFANNGPNALKILEKLEPDLILLDVMMPDMDGFEVCSRIKSDFRTKDIPVIFLTAKNDIEDIVRAFKAGAVDYITKPFNVMELKVRVSNHIMLRHAHLALEQSNLQLQKVNKEKDKFFSIIAHDLRNPFIGISSLSRIMMEQLKSQGNEEMEEFAREINQASNNAYNLLKNLLNWARSQTGKMEFNPERLQIRALIEETITLLKENARMKNIQLSVSAADDLYLSADREMLNIVLRNLISNAIKFTHEGGKVQVVAGAEEGLILVDVIDNGIGMSEKILADLFRIDASAGRKGTNGEPSTGLGLLLCQEFAMRNGGKVQAFSEQGKGSCFRISVPQA